jgi:hypothetical protein
MRISNGPSTARPEAQSFEGQAVLVGLAFGIVTFGALSARAQMLVHDPSNDVQGGVALGGVTPVISMILAGHGFPRARSCGGTPQ